VARLRWAAELLRRRSHARRRDAERSEDLAAPWRPHRDGLVVHSATGEVVALARLRAAA